MEYFEVLGLKKEPFMDTANPTFMYESTVHEECLHRLEISVRMGRGLNIVLGEVGTGKTTLAQALEEALLKDEKFLIGKILDPTFGSEGQFLEQIQRVFGIEHKPEPVAERKARIKDFLQEKGIGENKKIVLVIDEGQKLTGTFLETLRLLLNYQSRDRKLLNLVIFAQPELMGVIRRRPNFVDRIAVFYLITPLSQEETHGLIDFRLTKAGLVNGRMLFPPSTKDLIYHYSQGRPRKIVVLCHEAIEELVMREESTVSEDIVSKVITRHKDLDAMLAIREEEELEDEEMEGSDQEEEISPDPGLKETSNEPEPRLTLSRELLSELLPTHSPTDAEIEGAGHLPGSVARSMERTPQRKTFWEWLLLLFPFLKK